MTHEEVEQEITSRLHDLYSRILAVRSKHCLSTVNKDLEADLDELSYRVHAANMRSCAIDNPKAYAIGERASTILGYPDPYHNEQNIPVEEEAAPCSTK